MAPRCPACGLAFEREPGYFVGAIYINYAVTVGIALAGYFLLDATSALGPRGLLLYGVVVAVGVPLAFYRHSKALWLGLDHLVDPDARRPPGG
jgi:hypothetical protein